MSAAVVASEIMRSGSMEISGMNSHKYCGIYDYLGNRGLRGIRTARNILHKDVLQQEPIFYLLRLFDRIYCAGPA